MIWNKVLQAGEEGRSCASQSNGCCFDPAMVEQVFAFGVVHAEHDIQAMKEEFIRIPNSPTALEHMAGEWEDWEEEPTQAQKSGKRA